MASRENKYLALISAQEGSEEQESAEIEAGGGEQSNKYIDLIRSRGQQVSNVNIAQRPAIDIGVGEAFFSGVGRGLLEPVRFIGLQPDKDPRIDSPVEEAAHLLGNFAGVGIGFIPFAAGSGLALRGVGIVAGETVSPAAFSFLRNTLGGAAQFAGASESAEDIPKNLALGIGLGAAVEGVFFARAIRGRSAKKLDDVDDLIDTGSSVPDQPASSETLNTEQALTPTDGKSPERLVDEFSRLSNDDLSYEQIVAANSKDYETTVNLRAIDNADDVETYALEELGDNVQVFRRSVLEGKSEDVLIHNPITPEERLTPAQIAQWQETGFFEGMGVQYKGKTYKVNKIGGKLKEGYIQLSDPARPTLVFAAPANRITRPVYSRVFSEKSNRINQLYNLVRGEQNFGHFVIPSGTTGASRNSLTTRFAGNPPRSRRGSVDLTDFMRVNSLADFVRSRRDVLLDYEAPTVREMVEQYANDMGIPGMLEMDNGTIMRVHVFDQSRVQYLKEVPRLGLTDNRLAADITPEGATILKSYTPSWKNQIIGELRRNGVSEREAQEFLEMFRKQEGRRLMDLADDEIKSVARQTDLTIADGCF